MNALYGMLWLLVVHFVADFVLQSDWMAQNKSKSNYALGVHVTVYGACLLIASHPLAWLVGLPISFVLLAWVVGNTAAHFATDYITSRINSRLWSQKRVHAFFVGVGADQLVHGLTLGLSLAWLLQ